MDTHVTADPPVKDAATSRADRVAWALAALLLLWMAVVVTAAQWRTAPTFDEQNHVTRGIAILRTGDFRLCYHHPPLANILQGLPVAWGAHGFSPAMSAWQPDDLSIWDAAATTIWHRADDRTYSTVLAPQGLEIIRWARVPMLLFVLGLGLLLFLWGKALFGPWGGLLALACYALDPAVLAHGGLATTDMAAACTIALATYLLRGYVLTPTRGRLVLAGVGMGLALAAKFSALILVPITGLILLIIAVLAPRMQTGLARQWAAGTLGRRLVRALGVCALLGLVAGVVVWITYGGKVEALGSKPGQPVAAHASLKERLPVPAMQYFRGIKTVKSEAKGHRAYLLGVTDMTGKGWWYYFPVALATKMPLPVLIAIVGALLVLLVPTTRAHLALPGHEYLFLLLPAGIFLLAALGLLGISLNLGIRHVLPMLPFLYLLVGALARLRLPGRPLAIGLGALVLLQACSVARAYPDFLSYFNEAAGGPAAGHRILVDSNHDWGQGLGALAAWQRAQGINDLYVSYFGTTPPEAYGMVRAGTPGADFTYTPVAGFGMMRQEAPLDLANFHGYLAISASNLMMPIPEELKKDGEVKAPAADYTSLQRETPVARVGRTIFIYHRP